MSDAWKNKTARERADWIRVHAHRPRAGRLSDHAICELFMLSDHGFEAILCGADWQPSFERPMLRWPVGMRR